MRQMVHIFVYMSYKEPKESNNKVSEPMGLYLTQSPFHSLLGSSKLSNDFDIVKLARNGFPKRVLLSLAKKISLNLQELSYILHISERTLQRYDDEEIIKTEYAEKAVELARLYTRGGEVFGSMDKFKLWVKTPSFVFNGEAPVSMLDTSAGFDMVFKELGRIEHGIFV
jgi:putative toxin-antitoxin system antitoxin component (TIGR02293 family)